MAEIKAGTRLLLKGGEVVRVGKRLDGRLAVLLPAEKHRNGKRLFVHEEIGELPIMDALED